MSKMTVKDVKEFAMTHYNNGGDSIIECWDDDDIQDAINDGVNDEDTWLEEFNVAYWIRVERDRIFD